MQTETGNSRKLTAQSTRAFRHGVPVFTGPATEPRKINTPEGIDFMKGLAIQPFIFALTECLPDMDAQIDPLRRGPNYQRDLNASKGLLKALGDAGYSSKGNPYWVDGEKGEPTILQIEQLGLAAQACEDTLSDRYHVVSKVGKSEELQRFVGRFAEFTQAKTELLDMVALAAAWNRTDLTHGPAHRVVLNATDKCSLD